MSLASALRLPRPSPRRRDLILVGVIALPVLASLAYRVFHYDQPLALLLAPAAFAPVFLRHDRPFAALLLAIAVRSAVPDAQALLLPALAVLYTIASEDSWMTAAAAGVAVTIAALVAGAAWGSTTDPGGLVALVIGTGASSAAAVALGLYFSARRRVIDALRERAERLDRERELLADRAVAEERLRIAQELHDAIAHNVSLMIVQAQGLGATANDEHTTQTTNAIAELGRQAMAEMYRTLKLLRDDQTEAQLAPQPGLANLDHLLEQSRAAGVAIELIIEGHPRALPQTVDLSAFRIVQEALTNVVKHAAGAPTSVTLAYEERALRLTITDDGDDAGDRPAQRPAHGHGLIGMRERTSLFGGTLTAEPHSDHGFRVTATLPYTETDF